MKRKYNCILLMAVLAAAFVLGGCHGSRTRTEFTVPEQFDASRHYDLTFWAKSDTNKTQTGIYQKAIRDFEALYPNISVNLRIYTDYGKIYNDVITNIATETTPNVCITYPDHIATYLSGEHVVVPLDDLFADSRYGFGGSELRYDAPSRDEMIPQFLNECVLNGHYYAIPYMRSTEACYINKTYVERLGYDVPDILTWDYIWEVSEKATEKDADGNYLVNGQKTMIPFIYKSTDNMMIQMLHQMNAGYSTATGQVLIFSDTTKDLLYAISGHVKSGAFSTFKISSYPGNFLNAGQCLFAIDSTGGATWMGSEAPLMDISADRVVRFETVVRPIPQYDPEHPSMISQGPSVCVFNKKDPQEVLAAWMFAQYLLSNDVQIAYSETEGYVPVTSKAQNAPEYQDYLLRSGEDTEQHYRIKIEAAELLLNHTKDTFVTPVFNGSASLRDAAGQMIENVSKSTRRKETIDETYMENLFQDIRSLYRLNQGEFSASSERADLGPLPTMSVALLSTLGGIWVLLGLYAVAALIRRKKQR